ncbi:MAG: RagB/SusD family nutrient uptake outer membrane protein [Chitinophagaceae bacterium]|nr:RagB/SusD family nutrient uptake outer membrane protein [Chitinophagaceae bacterium]MCW5929158.1 RagB/SusD family nutrient uptake outer membrane protein [Chitinophagaceae bacterium]
MKNRIKYLFVIAIFAYSCNKNFLDRYPLDQQTEVTAFKTYENFKTYSWNLYGYFDGFPADGNYLPKNIEEEQYSDNMVYAFAGYRSPYAFQTLIEPASGGDWDFSYIRRVNLLIDNVEQSVMSETDKAHWRSVGYFFRALRYLDLVADFGDVPWIDHVLTDIDTLLYAGRTSRNIVTTNMLSDLLYAEEHIKANGDGVNTINQQVVRALISRFGLFEGTWRKYHQLGDADKYLEASFNASVKLISENPTLMSNYDDVFNSEDLAGKPGILLAKQYHTDLVMHSIGRVVRTAAWYSDVTRDAVESYLCSDGKPISTSDVYQGSGSVYAEFRNRDRRLYYTVLPPYKVRLLGGTTNSTTWEHTGNAADREYIDTMNLLSPSTAKQLPVSNFAGYLASGVPNFRQRNNGQGFIVSDLGFYHWKYYHRHSDNMALLTSTTDFPLFRMGEVLVNHAEAAFELGRFDQGIADQTVNRLRARGNVAPMTVSGIDGAFDAARDIDVDPLLWEIRRERRVELMGDGFRFRDIKRWKKGTYINNTPLGIWVDNANYNNVLTIYGGGPVGYVMQSIGEPPGWLDKYYLKPIPLNQFVLNPALEQNVGWRK